MKRDLISILSIPHSINHTIVLLIQRERIINFTSNCDENIIAIEALILQKVIKTN